MNLGSPHQHHLSRREFLKLAGLGAAGFFVPRSLFASEDLETISILHTTDLHSHLLPTRTYEGMENVGGLLRCATQIAQWRRDNPNSLLIDCGDEEFKPIAFSTGCSGRTGFVDKFRASEAYPG